MSNFKRYTMVIRRDSEGFATPALKVRHEGEVLKFDEVKELLQTSTNSDLMPLLRECVDYIGGVSGRSLKGDSLLYRINAVLAQLRAMR